MDQHNEDISNPAHTIKIFGSYHISVKCQLLSEFFFSINLNVYLTVYVMFCSDKFSRQTVGHYMQASCGFCCVTQIVDPLLAVTHR